MLKKIITYTLFGAMLFNSSANACTVWGAIDKENILLGKNRDYYQGKQQFRTIKNKGRYQFLGLYGDNEFDNNYTIKMGINEKGLTVFMTFASTVPLKQRVAKIPYYQVMENILANYRDVASVYKDRQTLLSNSTPINYIFADTKQALICEIGLNNNYSCVPYNRIANKTVTFAHTNHYIIEDLAKYNITPKAEQQTSYYRLNEINGLMNKNLTNLSLQKFVQFSFNTEAVNDKPLTQFDQGYNNTYQDNSIFRTFNSHPDRRNKTHPNSDQNVSTMIVSLPQDPQQPIKLYLRIIEQINDKNDAQYSQIIKYQDITTTLDRVIHDNKPLSLAEHTCIRTATSHNCQIKQ